MKLLFLAATLFAVSAPLRAEIEMGKALTLGDLTIIAAPRSVRNLAPVFANVPDSLSVTIGSTLPKVGYFVTVRGKSLDGKTILLFDRTGVRLGTSYGNVLLDVDLSALRSVDSIEITDPDTKETVTFK
jgi:hypothetical protein